jgi:hypothetical protein
LNQKLGYLGTDKIHPALDMGNDIFSIAVHQR